ncbi:MAG: hypothetical protein Q9227_007228 [Pyrenula ochraceoflavens]
MWILESSGDFLEGKRLWLRPGKEYLFGRVKKEGVSHSIDHKTISRKHFTIKVAPVKTGDGSRLHTRSAVTVTDENSKAGTHLDGVSLKNAKKELNRASHSLRPGNYPHELKIHWVPICLTFSFSSKERKAGDPVQPKRDRLEDLDIKAVADYTIDKTTHVVQSKRNTVAGLQALINGKCIVADEYVDAIVYAATPNDLEEPENLCPLERDFDAAWPDALRYLPPAGKEKTDHPPASFAPQSDRLNIFEGYIFVFYEPRQYENLLPAITSGHGKVLLCRAEPGKTSSREILQFVREAAGNKGSGDSINPRESGGVILVKANTKPEWQQWADDVADEVARGIQQQSVEQREFLDAILASDAGQLRKPNERSRSLTPPPVKTQIAGTQVKPFDDAFEDVIPWDDDDVSQEEQNPASPAEDNFDNTPVNQASGEKWSEKRRRRSLEDEENMVDELLPAAAAMKKRRLNERGSRKEPTPPPAPQKRKAKEKKIDILKEARQKREADEAAAEKKREDENAPLPAISGKGLAVIETFEVPSAPMQKARQNEWKEEWNGRKNFKGFRRQGDGATRRKHTQTVIVPLVEMPQKTYGIGREYWGPTRKEKRKEQETTQTQSQPRTETQTDSNPQTRSQQHGKRAASGSSASAAKRQKTLRSRMEEDDDSDDEGGGFRFDRRR